MIQPTVQKIISQLKKKDLSKEERSALLSAVLSKLNALPLNDTIVIGTNTVKINGKELSLDDTIHFRESCIALKDNSARKVLREQVRYLATNLGVYKALTIDELVFYKAALWCLQQEDELIDRIV